MKQTRQKTMILNAVMNRDDHPTAEMVHQELLSIDPHISLATVYRNLNTFAAKGKIRKIEMSNMRDRYDFRTSSHDHAYCVRCGKLIDVESRYPKKRHTLLEDDFKVNEVEVLYKGICKECRNQNNCDG